jgi:superfamily I DNA and/or RNA helicase
MWFLDSPLENADRVFKKQQFFKNEYGLNTTLLVSHFIKWKSSQKDEFYISPLIYQAVTVVKNQKISTQYDFEIDDTNYAINPVLISEFQHQFNIKLQIKDNNITSFIDELTVSLESNGDHLKLSNKVNSTDEWEIFSTQAIGNFNYKKSVLGQDYDVIINSANTSVKAILGEENSKENHLPNLDLPNSDNSQKEAISKSMATNLVIQGPPGTGKSHTIVELIKQNLLKGKTVLFVSEKKSALDVVYTKLKAEKLGHLIAYFNGEKSQKKEFYSNLKTAFNQFDSITEITSKSDDTIDLNNYFTTYSTELTAYNDNLDTSLFELLTYLAKRQVTEPEHSSHYTIPSYKLWQNYLEFTEDIETISISKFGCQSISELPFLTFNKAVFLDVNPLQKIETRLSELESNLKAITIILSELNLDWNWKKLSSYCLTATVLNMANTAQLDLLDTTSKKYKSFDTWTKKYELTQNKLKTSIELCSKWEVKPNLPEIDELIEELTSKQSKPWFTIFKTSKVDLAFKNYKGDLSHTLKLKALQNLKYYYELNSTLVDLKIKLKHNLNLLNPDIDINYILQLRQKLQSLSSNEYVFLLEQDNSLELIKKLHQLHPQIQQSNQIVNYVFSNYSIQNITDVLTKIEHVKTYNAQYSYYLPEIKKTLNLPSELLSYIGSSYKSVEQMTDEIVYFNYTKEVKFNTVLKHLNSTHFVANFKALKVEKSKKSGQQIQNISEYWVKNWKYIEELLNTPTSKLKAAKKLKKQHYKIAKRTIFHELAKQQQHLPIKQLVEQTNYSIFDIQPLWMMNPLSIAENLPCDADLFDLVIFDEASQIPFEDSIPAIYRAKQIVVVGDSKQMPPSQFFSNANDTTTLLNQAESVFKSHLLTWHYRSEHPRLIQFSNQHFYDNELNYFPSISEQNPIETIFVENGLFEDGININEAKVVAETYSNLLKNGIKNIGIIAFSKAQELQIKKEIDTLKLVNNDQLLIRNLENTQGIEKDIIIISIGYGFNSDRVFRMNFGPLNQDFGGNRLNVLLTRAKQKMIVASSVKSSDFKLSDNRGVSLLNQFLAFTEQNKSVKKTFLTHFLHQEISNLLNKNNITHTFTSATNGLAVNSFTQPSSGKILLVDPSLHLKENTDIYTLLSVIHDRFKSVKIVLSTDYLEHKERTEQEVIDFFR